MLTFLSLGLKRAAWGSGESSRRRGGRQTRQIGVLRNPGGSSVVYKIERGREMLRTCDTGRETDDLSFDSRGMADRRTAERRKQRAYFDLSV